MKEILCITAVFLALAVPAARADTLLAARTLRAQSVLSANDLLLEPGSVPGALSDPRDAIGLETRVAIYANRPIRAEDLGPPAIVDRNQTVTLVFQRGGLTIRAEGRALDRAGVGDSARVMNIASKSTVMTVIAADGTAHVLN